MYLIALALALIFVLSFVFGISKQYTDHDSEDFKFEAYSALAVLVLSAIGLYLLGLIWAVIVGSRRSLKVRDIVRKYIG